MPILSLVIVPAFVLNNTKHTIKTPVRWDMFISFSGKLNSHNDYLQQ